jgi:ketosteroid isomerase-like protein
MPLFSNAHSSGDPFMKRLTVFSVLAVTILGGAVIAQQVGPRGAINGRSPAPPSPGPLVDLVQASVNAYNKGDLAYFDRMLSDEILWVDEDGHELTSKMFCLAFIQKQIMATPKRTMSVSGIATSTWGDTAYAAFAYTIDDGVNKRTGMNTTVFRKYGSDWKIVLIHGSINAYAIPH